MNSKPYVQGTSGKMLFFFHVNPTVWTIGHIVPAHARDMKSKYGLGLGLNSMEGRAIIGLMLTLHPFPIFPSR